MRICAFGDLHITSGPRLEDHRSTLNAIVTDMLATDPDVVLLGGDIFGTTVPYKSTPAERDVLYPELVRLANVAPIVVVAGNHCDGTDIGALVHLGGTYPIHVVSGAEAIAVQTPRGVCNVYTLAYPWKRWLLEGEAIAGGAVGAQAAIEERLGLILGMWGHRIRRRRATHPNEPHVGLMHVQVGGAKTSGGEVLAGQEIELSRAMLDGVPFDFIGLSHLHMWQEVAERAHYASSTWRNDHSETDRKGWLRVQVARHLDEIALPLGREHARQYFEGGERLAATVEHYASPCRTFATLDYRWAADREDGAPRWIERPSPERIASCADAEVRMRLVVPEQWVSGCPWADEVAAVKRIAHRVKEERTIEPVLRVRAPEVAAAVTDVEKLQAYWKTTGTELSPAERAMGLAVMEELDTCDDAAIAAALAAL